MLAMSSIAQEKIKGDRKRASQLGKWKRQNEAYSKRENDLRKIRYQLKSVNCIYM